MTPILIKTIPHAKHRYETVGDWKIAGEEGADACDVVLVSEMDDPRHEFLVAVHELVEMFKCKMDGVKGEDVTRFDVQFEDERKTGPAEFGAREPGEDPRAPYYRQHQAATAVERVLAFVLGVDWDGYSRKVDSIGEKGDDENETRV